MKFFFRVDASEVIGSGHVMRCITLAKELKKSHEVEFICALHSGNLIQPLKEDGFVVHHINPSEMKENNMNASLLYDWEKDCKQTLDIVKTHCCDILIVDHYFLDYKWEEKINHYVSKLVVIDDLKNREHSCDLLIDQNYDTQQENLYEHLMHKKTQFLLGEKYALLRDEFLERRKQEFEGISTIFVYFGAADSTDETVQVLEAYMNKARKYKLKVLVGYINNRRNEIFEKYSNNPLVELYDQNNMISLLMQQSDISIGAGGSTTWERCCLGLPSIVVTVANNQVEPMKELEKKGIIYLLEHKKNKYDDLFELLDSGTLGSLFWKEIQRKGIETYDGQGKTRIKRVLEVL